MSCTLSHRLAVAAALALVLNLPPVLAAVPGRLACDAGHETLLRATPPLPAAFVGARAAWLDASQLRWAGVPAAGRFRLVHARAGGLSLAEGQPVRGADAMLTLDVVAAPPLGEAGKRFSHIGDGVTLAVRAADRARLPALHRGQLLLVQQDAQGRVQRSTAVQAAGALDALFAASAEKVPDLGSAVAARSTAFKLWAPTAHSVALCLYGRGDTPTRSVQAMRRDARRGVWRAAVAGNVAGHYYTYLVDVFVPGRGLLRNRVTDPYSISLTTDSQRSYIANLNAASLKPAGWDATPRPDRVAASTDMVVYELHVRDFSVGDPTVPAAHRGKYAAFGVAASNGMQHLRALSRAGVTDVHLLPVFDLASVPERGCTTPSVPEAKSAAPDSDAQQAAVMQGAAGDCFNWGYDPWHYTAPEGSYASDAADGAVRIREFRAMVQALHRAGLRVGMDMVYNHTTASGQHERSVLDRIVPGYYHRLDGKGGVEKSTCCDNTATEHRMMAKLMIDSAVVWTRDHKIDSMRFDLMGHQPRAAMERLQRAVDAAAGRHIHLLGEGWNYAEVENGKRFVQASQQSLNGSGIGTFSDRARDAVRGGWGGSAEEVARTQGYINGLHYDRNAQAPVTTADDLKRSADLVRVGLAGTLRRYEMTTASGERRPLDRIDYNGQGAGYTSQPGEAVNYIENHDNQTLFDNNASKLPSGPNGTSREDRARVQTLGAAIVAFSQGIAYFHAGQEILRSKSLDRNSYDSGDWFNRLDWSLQDNFFGSGLPPQRDNAAHWPQMKALLTDTSIKPTPADIRFARDSFLDLLRIRASSTLFRLRTADDVGQRLSFHNTGPAQLPTVLVGHLDGVGYPGAAFKALVYLVNVDKQSQTVTVDALKGQAFTLHPVHSTAGAADPRAASATYAPGTGAFSVPARTAVVFVVN